MSTTLLTGVRVEVDAGVATLTLDRAPLNVLNIALLSELEVAVRDLQGDRDLRLIVIRGAGRAFSAGVEVAEHLGGYLEPMLDAFDRAARAIVESEIPVLAVVHGPALGGACELVALCDLAIAAEDAKLGTPEITLGVVPPVGAVVFPSLVGRQRARALVLTGELITGGQAAAWGLIWRAVPPERLEEDARVVIEAFRGRSAASLRLAKRTLALAATPQLLAAISAADAEQRRCLPGLADADEGLRAFLGKRPPRWTHR
ncbi:MAG TPA: enoyl-CoA hydratase-related protein [Candidatus Limnocylindria bacterium]